MSGQRAGGFDTAKFINAQQVGGIEQYTIDDDDDVAAACEHVNIRRRPRPG